MTIFGRWSSCRSRALLLAICSCAIAFASASSQQSTIQAGSPPNPGSPSAMQTTTTAPISARPPAPPVGISTTFEDKLLHVLHDSTLANGLQVIVIENHTVPLVTVIVTVRTGAFTQEPGQEGVPHLFEHMLYKSYNEDRRSWGQAMSELDIAGYNGETGDEMVRYFITLPSENVEGGMRALAELVRDPEFTEEDLVQERRVVYDELNRRQSSPFGELSEEVDQRLWTTAWGRKDPSGNEKALSAANVQELKQIFKRYYVPNNSALIVSGDVTAERAFRLANERFGHWPRQADPLAGSPMVTPPPLKQSAGIIHEQKLEDVIVMVAWQGPSTLTDPTSTYAADVLSTILNEAGSTFQKHLVDNGLFASCAISYRTRANVGPITLVAHTSVDSFPHAMKALATELSQLGTPTAFTDEELEDARQSRTVGTVLELEHRTAVGQEIAEFWASAGLGYFMTYADRLGAVSRPQITAYVNRYMGRSPMVIGVMSPPNTGNSLSPVVASFVNTQTLNTQTQ